MYSQIQARSHTAATEQMGWKIPAGEVAQEEKKVLEENGQ